MAEFDSDHDGKLTSEEIAQAPGLNLSALDADGSGDVTADEITSRIKQWQATQVGMVSYHLVIAMNGSPLENAEVTLEPYGFLGSEVLPASGLTDARGTVTLSVAEASRPIPNLPTMHCGFYRIRISKKSGDKELIPARYNSHTQLGCEIAPDQRNAGKTIEITDR